MTFVNHKHLTRCSKALLALTILLVTVLQMPAMAYAATKRVSGYNMASLQDTANYDDNQPINRVFYVRTGNTSESRKLIFEQRAGSISYYMYRNTEKSCMGSYRILAYNKGTQKGTSYSWKWSTKKTITLDKNSSYVIIVYPEDFDVVCEKYLTTKILKLQPIIYGYKESPRFTVTTYAPSFTYDENGSIRIAGT